MFTCRSLSIYPSCLLFLLTTLSLGDEGNENSHQSTLTHLIREQPSGSSKHFNVWVHWITGVCACVCVGGLSYIKEAGLQKKKKKQKQPVQKPVWYWWTYRPDSTECGSEAKIVLNFRYSNGKVNSSYLKFHVESHTQIHTAHPGHAYCNSMNSSVMTVCIILSS